MLRFACLYGVILFGMVACQPGSGGEADRLAHLPPPIPAGGLSASEELKYIGESDQYLRNQMTWEDLAGLKSNAHTPLLDSIDFRDSIRWRRVMQLYQEGRVKSPEDQYYAGLVFLHTGGSKIREDSLSLELATSLFSEVAEHVQDSVMQQNAINFLRVATDKKGLETGELEKGWNIIYLEKDSHEKD
ncbi:MAG: hypothetical protein H6581_16680 [Bacteroidia bacterium]|nr:hypothetical protein [Bacteroidia bacterium]